ncbi:MAG: AMP-binding protein [Myxococcota bacterium]|nr:AMP-binding protein [Myxococcota bacterium]
MSKPSEILSGSDRERPEGETQPASLDLSDLFAGRHLFLTGTTGFVGKVLLALLASEFPRVRRISLLIRSGRYAKVDDRFQEEVLCSEPLRAVEGKVEGGLAAWAEKVSLWEGDITAPRLGLSDEGWTALTVEDPIELLIHCAGNVNFDPPLDEALSVNAFAADDKVEFAAAAGCPLVHMSTCFVVGGRSGEIPEQAPRGGYAPNGAPFDPVREAAEAKAEIARIYSEADEQGWAQGFESEARERLLRDGFEEGAWTAHRWSQAVKAARRRWRGKRLREAGMSRAKRWGWTNTYTYSKSLGEQLLINAAAREQVPVSIVRPSIVESALRFPFPGWNEGVNTCAPIVYLYWRGQRLTPSREENVLDVIPVDQVAQGTLLAAAERLDAVERDRAAALEEVPVYQLATGVANPLLMRRAVELTNLAWRRRYDRDKGFWQRELFKSLDTVCIDQETYERVGAPAVKSVARLGQRLISSLPKQAAGALGGVKGALKGLERAADTADKIFELFAPFIREHDPRFRSDAIVEVTARLSRDEQRRLAPRAEDIEWRHYWMNVHMEGLQRWAFGILDEKTKPRIRRERSLDLVELFRESAKRFPDQIALQHFVAPKEGREAAFCSRYDYQELWDGARRAAAGLRARGLNAEDRVLLLGENEPAWPMIFLGILLIDAVPVPLDPALPVEALERISAKSAARLLVHHESLLEERLEEPIELRRTDNGLPPSVTVGELFADAPLNEEEISAHDRSAQLASLIFTSGTTGDPKGVMLSHSNFTALLESLHQVFEVRAGDRFLSVLPLFHSFEFSCGLLLPLSAGASVTYLDELDGPSLRAALLKVKPTALIGVPALWELLQRRIKAQVEDQGEAAKMALSVSQRLNRRLRERYQLNLGPLLFKPIHERFGGSIRYLISGGAALDERILESFEGLGFELLEGYGLTEAAPVLAVRRPKSRARGVGAPLPGIEVKIEEPDESGVGEVLARGDNVMRGYLDAPEETASVLDEEGWLRTGDLGQIDERGSLKLVGRRRELIVTSEGKNIYPDELEPRYNTCALIDEIALLGVPDPRGDQLLAALIVLSDDAKLKNIDIIDVEIKKHLRRVGGQLAPYQRIRRWEISEEQLPRTSTRKLRRGELLACFEEAARRSEGRVEAHAVIDSAALKNQHNWLYAILADLSGLPVGDLHEGTGLIDELGLSSLQLVELRVQVEEKLGRSLSGEALAAAMDIRALQALIDHGSEAAREPRTDLGAGQVPDQADPPWRWSVFEPRLDEADPFRAIGSRIGESIRALGASLSDRIKEGDLPLPDPLTEGGRKALHEARSLAFRRFFQVDVLGRGLIPQNEQVIVVANHCSHLDVGLVKYALGAFGEEICSLAAADYFFDQGVKRQFFENFSYLIPLERGAPLEEGLAPALDALEQGFSLLLFPEGTRSVDGQLQPFKVGVGYLQRNRPVSILPLYLRGTHRAFGKGSTVPIPRARRLSVQIGRPISQSLLDERCAQLPEVEAYREVATLCEQAVTALRDGNRYPWEEAKRRRPKVEDSLKGLFERLCKRLDPDALDTPTSWYFSIQGTGGGRWSLYADHVQARAVEGRPEGGRADCVLKCDAALFQKMIEHGYVPSLGDFADGKVKTNAPNHLRTLQRAFKLGERS